MPTGVYVRTPAVRKAMLKNLAKGRTPEVREKATASIIKVWTEDKRREVSEKNKKIMRDPGVRKRHLKGLEKARRDHGVNFKGGNGRTPVKMVRILWKKLKKNGWVRELPIKTKRHTTDHTNVATNYKVDFGHRKMKIAIEVDGPCHRAFAQKKKDRKKQDVLESLGWFVIRVKHK